MEYERARQRLNELEYVHLTSEAVGRLLYEFVLVSGVEDVLELGFANGTSTAYIAAALDEKRRGRVTTVDRRQALERTPNLHAVLDHVGLERWVDPVVVDESYTWELMRLLERHTSGARTEPCFDFCFIDGAHTWEVDGLAFLLVDRLLRPDRWIVLDDLAWSFASSPALRESERVRRMPSDARVAQQVRQIVELIVRPMERYELRLVGNVALAYKLGDGDAERHRSDFDHLASEPFVRELAVGALSREDSRR